MSMVERGMETDTKPFESSDHRSSSGNNVNLGYIEYQQHQQQQQQQLMQRLQSEGLKQQLDQIKQQHYARAKHIPLRRDKLRQQWRPQKPQRKQQMKERKRQSRQQQLVQQQQQVKQQGQEKKQQLDGDQHQKALADREDMVEKIYTAVRRIVQPWSLEDYDAKSLADERIDSRSLILLDPSDLKCFEFRIGPAKLLLDHLSLSFGQSNSLSNSTKVLTVSHSATITNCGNNDYSHTDHSTCQQEGHNRRININNNDTIDVHIPKLRRTGSINESHSSSPTPDGPSSTENNGPKDNAKSNTQKAARSVEETLVDRIRQNDQLLMELLECQYGLLDSLINRGLLNEFQLQDIESHSSPYLQNRQLLRVITSILTSSDLTAAEGNGCSYVKNLTECLKENGQRHLASVMLDASAGSGKPDDADQFLSDSKRQKLRINQRDLVTDINSNGELLDHLLSKGVISRRHLSSMRSKRDQFKRNGELLEIIRRRSCAQYTSFISSLRDSEQDHIADLLEKPGAVVALNVSLNSDGGDKSYLRNILEKLSEAWKEMRAYTDTNKNTDINSKTDSNMKNNTESNKMTIHNGSYKSAIRTDTSTESISLCKSEVSKTQITENQCVEGNIKPTMPENETSINENLRCISCKGRHIISDKDSSESMHDKQMHLKASGCKQIPNHEIDIYITNGYDKNTTNQALANKSNGYGEQPGCLRHLERLGASELGDMWRNLDTSGSISLQFRFTSSAGLRKLKVLEDSGDLSKLIENLLEDLLEEYEDSRVCVEESVNPTDAGQPSSSATRVAQQNCSNKSGNQNSIASTEPGQRADCSSGNGDRTSIVDSERIGQHSNTSGEVGQLPTNILEAGAQPGRKRIFVEKYYLLDFAPCMKYLEAIEKEEKNHQMSREQK